MKKVRWNPPSAVKRPIRRVLSPLGFELVRLRRPETQLYSTLLQRESISLLVDVGANQGQYATRMRILGYSGRIHSFEPGREAFALLRRHAASDPLWDVHEVALAESAGQRSLYVSDDSVSSSLLPVAEAHVRAAPASVSSRVEPVATARLDDLLPYDETDRIWLKLDTQGSEDKVLAGASAVLGRTRVVQTELAVLPCYDGQASYQEVMDVLHVAGFALVAVEPGTQDPTNGEMLQFDGIFVRDS